jgi:endonuclease YncB( thermonuclease family)
MYRLVIFILLCCGVYGACTEELPDSAHAEIEQVVEVVDAVTFIADIKEYPPIIGKGIEIQIAGVVALDPDNDGAKRVAKAKAFTYQKLKQADCIELRNMQRGESFRIVAEVWVDGVSLGETLFEYELAKLYNKKHGPTW